MKGSSAVLIIAAVIYFTFMSQLALALGYEPTSIANLATSIGGVHLGILSFLFDIAAWVVSSVAIFFCMIGFTVTGAIPLWLGAFFFVPVGLGITWAVMELLRG
jgi:hypothetical protein